MAACTGVRLKERSLVSAVCLRQRQAVNDRRRLTSSSVGAPTLTAD